MAPRITPLLAIAMSIRAANLVASPQRKRMTLLKIEQSMSSVLMVVLAPIRREMILQTISLRAVPHKAMGQLTWRIWTSRAM